MRQIGIRELRQHASRWLREVENGERFEVTDRGRVVALLTPPQRTKLDRLVAAGMVRPPHGDVRDLEPPIEPAPGVALPSRILADMRENER